MESVGPEVIWIMQDRTDYTESINRITRFSHLHGTIAGKEKQNNNKDEDPLNEQEQEALVPNENRQYVVDRIICILEKRTGNSLCCTLT